MKNVFVMMTIATVFLTASLVAEQGAKLLDDKVFATAGEDKSAPQIRGARLSPDGQHLLYMRAEVAGAKPEGYAGRWPRRLYRLMLRDLSTGKEKLVPMPTWTWDDPLLMMLSRNIFDAAGKRIVLGVGATETQSGVFNDRRGTMKPALYDIASGKIETLALESEMVLPMFDRAGKRLIILAIKKKGSPESFILTPGDKLEPKKLDIDGFPFDMCPTADVLPVLRMSKRDPDKGQEKPKFFLYDLVAQKTIVELPFGERNTMLDDFPPKWTAGGRYLYYYDVEVPDDAPRGARKYLVRIWDRTENKEAAIIEKAIPIGPGPGKTTMVLSLRGNPSVVHDATTGKKFVLFAANKKVQLLFAGGGKIVYARRFASGKIEYHVAKIHVPDEGEKKSTAEGDAIPVRQ